MTKRIVLCLGWMILLGAVAGAVQPVDWVAQPSDEEKGENLEGGIPPLEDLLNPASEKEKEAEESRVQEKKRLREASTLYTKLIAQFKAEKYDLAKGTAREIIKLTPENGTAYYNLACAQSRLGETELAIKTLGISIGKGFVSIRHMERDPDLEPLWKLDGFKKILARREQLHRDRGKKILEALVKRYGEDYIVEIDHDAKLVFATNTDRATLDDLKTELTRQANSLWADLFDHKFEQYITIIIPKPGAVRMGIAAGVYQPGSAQLIAKRVGMTLRHEFTHALHFADIEVRGQVHPIWALEGMAALFETSVFEGDTLVPQPSERLTALQYYLAQEKKDAAKKRKSKKFKLPSLEAFLKFDQPRFMRKPHLSYAMGRYLMMYLHEKGKLREWYLTYTSGFEKDSTGQAAWEKVFDKDLAAIEADWKEWVRNLPSPARFVQTNHAYIGVSVAPVVEGLNIRLVVPGSGAAKAGLKAGDLIVKIDGHRLADGGELIRMVTEHEVGDTLKVRYRRDGEYADVSVTLGKKPAVIGAPRAPKAKPKPKPAPPPSRKKQKAA